MPITSTRFRAGLRGRHASGAIFRCQRGGASWERRQTTGTGVPVRAHGFGLARLVLAKPAALAHAVRSWPEKHMAGACHSSSASVSFTLQLSTSNCAASTVYPQDP